MKKNLLAALFILFSAGVFAQTVHTITVAGNGNMFMYSPDTVMAEIGDTVRWINGFGNTAPHPTTATSPVGAFPDFTIQLNNPENDWVPTLPGTVDYECTTHAGLGMVGVIIVTGIPANVEDNSFNKANVTAFPNPTDGSVTIKLGNTNASTVEVFNMMGQQVFTESVNGRNNVDFDLSHLPAGSYFYRVMDGEAVVATRKLIVK